MKKLNVTVQCMAVYNSSIEVPDDMNLEQAIEYAKEHIDEINCGELEYISDSDVLDEENCDFGEETRTVRDLSRDEINELKEAYATQLKNDGISYGELAESHEIPDDIIFNHYEGVIFTEDDFFCNQ